MNQNRIFVTRQAPGWVIATSPEQARAVLFATVPSRMPRRLSVMRDITEMMLTHDARFGPGNLAGVLATTTAPARLVKRCAPVRGWTTGDQTVDPATFLQVEQPEAALS